MSDFRITSREHNAGTADDAYSLEATKQAAQAQTSAPVQSDAGATPPGDAFASIVPMPNRPDDGVLGQIPADQPLPGPGGAVPLPPAQAAAPDPKAEFDTAMGLLTRAQYVPASTAFRSFVDAHPDDENAPQALYWVGDIAYSIRKDYEEGARNFAELLKKYPKAPRAPEGMLKLGLALIQLDQMTEGCAALAALPARYPNASPTIATRARNERRDNKCR